MTGHRPFSEVRRQRPLCGHCGRAVKGLASVTDRDGKDVPVCHPSDPAEPDCYRRVTVYHEPLGYLMISCMRLPAGIERTSHWDVLAEITRIGEELEHGPVTREYPDVGRFEVINHAWTVSGQVPGRIVSLTGLKVALSLQDGGRTLKVFLSDRETGDDEKA